MNVLRELERYVEPSIDEIASEAIKIMDFIGKGLNDDEVAEKIMKAFPQVDSSWWLDNWDEISDKVDELKR